MLEFRFKSETADGEGKNAVHWAAATVGGGIAAVAAAVRVLWGLIGVFLACALFEEWWLLWGAYSLAGPIVQALGRMRCLVQGCCHGARAREGVGIAYRREEPRVSRMAHLRGVPVHATQLYSILWNVVTALVLGRLWADGAAPSLVAGCWLMLNGVGRFVEEAYRGEVQTAVAGGPRLYQWLAAASVAAGGCGGDVRDGGGFSSERAAVRAADSKIENEAEALEISEASWEVHREACCLRTWRYAPLAGTLGKKIVLAASDSESNEFQQSSWRQMLLATLPAKHAQIFTGWSMQNETWPDGQAKHVPHGLRIIEALLKERFGRDNVAVCYPEQLPLFVGPETRAVGIHAHNPLGITFATDVYSGFSGAGAEPINAAEFRRLITHPVLRQYRAGLKVIVGGPGGWQIERKGLVAEWRIDTIVDGEAEEVAADLFEAAARGEELPARVECRSPRMERIPLIENRSTFGVVEITRGCGRGCQFCSVALRAGKSFPLEHILENVRRQVAQGAESILLVTEDLFLYEQGPKFKTNKAALRRLFESVGSVPGVKHVMMTHGTMAPVVAEPGLLEEIGGLAVDKSLLRHEASTRGDGRYAMMFVGLETGSVRLFERFMKGKCYPFRPAQWPDVIMKGVEVMNRHNWFPMCTFILGLPGETREDTKQALDLLYALKGAKWSVIPTLFSPLDETRLAAQKSARVAEMTDLQWEFFFTCWRYNIDFFRNTRSVQWKFNLGVPLYYYLMGRKLFGPAMKYPLFRFGHLPERWMRGKLYLDFSADRAPRHRVPEHVPVPEHGMGAALPVLGTD